MQTAKITRIVPPIWLLAFLIAAWLLTWFLPLPWKLPGSEWVGRLIMLLSFAWIFYCAHLFRKHTTPLKPFVPVKAVITEGPYAVSRNPVYVAMIGVLVGWAVVLGSVYGWLAVVVFAYGIRRFWVLPEEQQMEQEMGQAYLDYKAKVNRWF